MKSTKSLTTSLPKMARNTPSHQTNWRESAPCSRRLSVATARQLMQCDIPTCCMHRPKTISSLAAGSSKTCVRIKTQTFVLSPCRLNVQGLPRVMPPPTNLMPPPIWRSNTARVRCASAMNKIWCCHGWTTTNYQHYGAQRARWDLPNPTLAF